MRPPRFLLVALLSMTLAAAAATAQTPYLVHDLGTGPLYPWSFIGPREAPVNLDGVALFFHDDGRHGRELWRSDGTALGTYLVRDLCPGSCGADSSGSGALARVGSRVFLAASDGIHGAELWVTDGTAAGTSMVLDIRPGLFGSEAGWFRSAAGLLFFAADDGDHGQELWRSDGTAAGTYLVKDLHPGPTSTSFQAIQPATGHLWLAVDGLPDVRGLWVSDGTAAGTIRRVDLAGNSNAGSRGIRSSLAVLPTGVAIYRGLNTVSTYELWRSDGTAPGTFKIRDLTRGNGPVIAAGAWAYFVDAPSAADPSTLYRTEGSIAGTGPVGLPGDTTASLLTLGVAAGSRVLVAVATLGQGWEPWAVDDLGAVPLGDLNPGAPGSLPFDLYRWLGGATVSPSQAVFLVDDGTPAGQQLWVSDGTPAGTRRLTDFPAGYLPAAYPARVELFALSSVGGALFLPTWDEAHGSRLWRADLATATTGLVAPLPGSTTGVATRRTEDPLGLDLPSACHAVVGSRLLFGFRRGPSTSALGSSDGSVGGLETLASPIPFSSWDCASIGEHALAYEAGQAAGTSGYRLTDALPEGTGALFSPGGEANGDARPPLVSLADRWALSATQQLWESDGSLGGSIAVASLTDPQCWPTRLVGGPGKALFGCRNLETYTVSSGTSQLLHSFAPDGRWRQGVAIPNGFAVLAEEPATGLELWWTDGTAAGTRLPRDIAPGVRSAFPQSPWETFRLDAPDLELRLAPLGSRILFAADDGVHGEELWVSDGTEAGTVLLGDLYPGSYPSTPRELVAAGDRVYFVAEHPWLGRELWVSDGTSDGTRVLVDLVAGSESSRPGDLAFLDGELYFSAWTATYGREAWRTDGVTKLTLRLTDIAPGSQSSSPGLFRRIGPRLFFAADDGLHGSELWAISDDGTVPLFHDDTESGSLLRWDAAQI